MENALCLCRGSGLQTTLHWFAVSTMVCGIIVGKGWSDVSRDFFSFGRGLHGHLVANGHARSAGDEITVLVLHKAVHGTDGTRVLYENSSTDGLFQQG